MKIIVAINLIDLMILNLFLIFIFSCIPDLTLTVQLLQTVFNDGNLPLNLSIIFDKLHTFIDWIHLGHELKYVIVDEVVFEDGRQQFACNLMNIFLDSVWGQFVLIKHLTFIVLCLIVEYYIIYILNQVEILLDAVFCPHNISYWIFENLTAIWCIWLTFSLFLEKVEFLLASGSAVQLL